MWQIRVEKVTDTGVKYEEFTEKQAVMEVLNCSAENQVNRKSDTKLSLCATKLLKGKRTTFATVCIFGAKQGYTN